MAAVAVSRPSRVGLDVDVVPERGGSVDQIEVVQSVEVLIARFLDGDERVICRSRRPDELIELALRRRRLTILRVLDHDTITKVTDDVTL